jgi:two-component system, NtrC family, sensor kinase
VSPRSADSSPGAHILVVDDDPEIAESLVDFLSRSGGYRVSQAGDGPKAMAFLESNAQIPERAVDLVLLDVRMPGVSGPQVLTWMRNHSALQYTRVIMLTAAAGNEEKVEALSAGADDYITKPYYPQELLARVKTLLRSQQLEKQLQKQSQQLSVLNRVSQNVTSRLTTDDVFIQATAGVLEVLDAQVAAVFMADQQRSLLRCRQVQPVLEGRNPSDWPPVPVGRGVIGRVLLEGAGLRLNSPSADPHFDAVTDAPTGLSVQAMLATPLVVRDSAVGVLCAYRTTGPFQDLDTGLLTSLASAVSRALEITWLFQSVRSRQRELLEGRNTLQAIIDGIRHPIYTIDEVWQVVSVNLVMADQLSIAPDKAIEKHCYSVFFGRTFPCEHCVVARTLQDKTAERWSVSWQDDDRLPKEWDVNVYPIPGTKPGAARAVVVWQDRTEERRLENSLVQAGKLAAVGQLAAGVAHEINNPLTAINANAQMLQMMIPPDHEQYESIELIARAGERAAKVVRGLLDFARQAQYDFQVADLNHSVQQALNLVAYQLSTANIELSSNLAPELPPVNGSWEHLQSVWLNLLINARDAVQDAGATRRIEVVTRLDKASEEVLVLVRDTGRGMTPAELEHIFEPFYTTKSPGQGTGLGLATCQRIIHQHGGQIEAISKPGQGTTVVVRLPVEATSREAASSTKD